MRQDKRSLLSQALYNQKSEREREKTYVNPRTDRGVISDPN